MAAASCVPPQEGQFLPSSYLRTKPASPSAAPAHSQRFPLLVSSPVLWSLFQPHTWEGAAAFGSPPRGGMEKDVSSLCESLGCRFGRGSPGLVPMGLGFPLGRVVVAGGRAAPSRPRRRVTLCVVSSAAGVELG